ncbi:MAG: hypothetical protein GY931_11505 [Maribacter sp.]|nr:hypothetical protein [Maribacter sp.]
MIKHEIRDKNGGTRTISLSPLKAIRYQCLECMGFSPSQVVDCTSPLCSLFPYRLGKDESRKGTGGQGNAEALLKYRSRQGKKDQEAI